MNIGGVHSLLVQGFEEKVYDELRSLGEEILLHTVTDMLGDRDRVSSSYISSNSVVEDRMGSLISMLTVYGIAVEGTRNALHIEPLSNTLGSKKPFPLIITPKRIAKTRNKMFQRIYELLAAIHGIGDEEKIFFNWNYNRFLREIYMLEEVVTLRLLDTGYLSLRKELDDVIKEYTDFLSENIRENIPRKNIRESFKYIVDLLPKAYNELFERIASMKIFTGNKFDDIIDYTTLIIERNIFEILFQDLLDKTKKNGIDVFWVTSNPDDNYISRTNHILSWINDTVILMYIWRNLDQAVLKVNDITTEDSVKEDKFVLKYEETPQLAYAYLPAIISRLSYDFLLEHQHRRINVQRPVERLWYAKFSRYGPIIQLVYPEMYASGIVEDGLKELFTVSDKRAGYPRPLVLVRRACRISEEVARGLGDSLLRRVDNPLLRTILNRKQDFTENLF